MKLWKSFSLTAFAVLMTLMVKAGNTSDKDVPLDPKTRMGTLENGFTYYIRHNETPENRAEFYLFNDVGAILETAEQNGLAHFAEHMAFNGTDNFPDKGVLDYMESIGVKFGHNVNAFTSYDMTVYNLANVPVAREGVIDSSLLVLHDWAGKVSYENEEIDNERGVIHEEWRTRRSAEFRMRRQTNMVLFEGSKYAEHDIIGDIDIIDNFEYETLKSFYDDWYRPDLQAVAIVGDVDVELVEKKIKDLFSGLEMPENAKERYVAEVPDHKEPRVAIVTDEEASRSMVSIYYKHDAITEKDMDYYRQTYLHKLYMRMINNRLSELTQQANPPFVYGYSYYGNVVRDKDAFVSLALAGNDQLLDAVEALTTENQKVLNHGFTATELERTKKSMLSDLKKQYNNRNKVKSRKLVWNYLSHFMTDEPAPGIEFEYDYAQKVFPEIELDEVNELAGKWITDENMVVAINAIEKEGTELPEKEDILKTIATVKGMQLEKYEDAVTDKPLVEDIEKAGEVINESTSEKLGTTTMELSNGLKITVKPTDFKENEILMKAYSPGGLSLVDDQEIASARLMSAFMSVNGLGEFSSIALNKKLSDKNVSVNASLSDLKEEIRGNCESKDLETMLQLTHLHFMEPREDEVAAASIKQRYGALLENRSADPRYAFRDSVQAIKSNYHKRESPFDKELLEKSDYQKAREIYAERFSNASDFEFFFVGNIDPEEAKPLFEKYLGSLKTTNKQENFVDHGIYPPKGEVKKVIEREMKVPKASVYVNFNGDFNYDKKNILLMRAIDHILELRYTETIREEQGGSYGVGVRASTSNYPKERFSLSMQFDCAPEKYEMLKEIVYEEAEKLYTEGPSKEDLKKAREYFLKLREEQLKENSFWLSALEKKSWNKMDVTDDDYESMVKSLTVKDIKKAAKKYLKGAGNIDVVMIPEG